MKDYSMKEILEFDIVKDIGVVKEEDKEELSANISEVLMERIFISTIAILPEEEVAGLEEMFSRKASFPEIMMFLGDRIENIEEIIGREVLELKKESLELLK